MKRKFHGESSSATSIGGGHFDAEWAKGVRLAALANLAHELRTPLQVLLGYIDALRDEMPATPPGRARRMVDRMNANANELARIVENIMEFAQSEEQIEQLGDDEVATFELLDEVTPLLESINQEKGLKLSFDIACAPTLLRARHRPLRLILANLAVNAVRFTSQGRVHVAIREAGKPGSPEIEIEVADTGPGFNPEQIDDLFEPFSQLSSSNTRRYRGVGLGLSVVKRNIAVLAGRLEIYSTPGRGTRFVARVPVRAPAENAKALLGLNREGDCPLQ
ncbi:MAG: sensor histidine kinase [Candidatus Binataceae bacterium]